MTISCSYEFFPPGNALGERRFWRTLGCLETLNPSFFSITYGALGSAQDNSVATIRNVLAESQVPVAAHLTFEGSTKEEIINVAAQLRDMGVDKIVALRGDDRDNAINARKRGDCYDNVAEFIAGLLEIHPFDISVACYPEVHPKARNAADDILALKSKVDAGANRVITQFFFDIDAMQRFQDRADAAGISVPVVPGILPVRDFTKMTQFAERCGTAVPKHLYERFSPAKDDPALAAHLAKSHAEEFIDSLNILGYEKFHIYTLNQPIELAQCAAGSRAAIPKAANA